MPSGYVLVHDSAGEPAIQSVRGRVSVEYAFGSEFEVGGATPGEDVPWNASRKNPLSAVAEK